jgi:hypothetical protein
MLQATLQAQPGLLALLLLLHLPLFRRYVERQVGGCGGASCELPQASSSPRLGSNR